MPLSHPEWHNGLCSRKWPNGKFCWALSVGWKTDVVLTADCKCILENLWNSKPVFECKMPVHWGPALNHSYDETHTGKGCAASSGVSPWMRNGESTAKHWKQNESGYFQTCTTKSPLNKTWTKDRPLLGARGWHRWTTTSSRPAPSTPALHQLHYKVPKRPQLSEATPTLLPR